MEQENKIKAYKGFNIDMTDVSEKFIDWEQRRFEIAKDLYLDMLTTHTLRMLD